MNKKYFKLSFLVFFLMAFVPAVSFANPLRSETFKAIVKFVSISTNPVTILHNQNIFILQDPSFTITGTLIPLDNTITIDAVNLEYYGSSSTSTVVLSTNTYDASSNAFTVFVDNIDMANDYIFYRIKVDYTKEFIPSAVPVYSGWYTIRNPKIYHNDILRISPFQRRMVPVGNVSNMGVTDLKIEYYVNGDTASVRIASADNPVNFISEEINIIESETLVHYRLKAVFDNDNSKVKYYPSPSTSTFAGWIKVPVISSSSAIIDAAAGGLLILDNEDQRYGKSSIKIYENTLSANTKITFEECDIAASYVWPRSKNIIKVYRLHPDTIAFGTGVQPADLTLYYGSENEGKYEIKYWDGTSWLRLATSQDFDKKTVSAKTETFGYFAVIIEGTGADSDYRPVERAFMPGEKIIFRNLKTGDSVTIFNLKGQPIKTLASYPFEWDGRTNSGGYAESGSYIYQIKVEGRVVSGSLAFVR